MKTLILIAASGVAAGGLYAGGAFDRGEVYDLPLSVVRARLVSVEFPAMAAISAGGKDPAGIHMDVSDNVVRWTLNAETGAVFIATLRPEGPMRTRVVLDHQPGKSAGGPGERLLATSFMRDFAKSGFHEEVDARIEGRAPDQDRALHAFAERAAADPRHVRELGLAVEGMMKDIHEQVNANMPPPADRPGVFTQTSTSAATRPSVVLPTN